MLSSLDCLCGQIHELLIEWSWFSESHKVVEWSQVLYAGLSILRKFNFINTSTHVDYNLFIQTLGEREFDEQVKFNFKLGFLFSLS